MKIGHVRCDAIWQILFLYGVVVRDADDSSRILLAENDTNKAFHQVFVDTSKAAVLGYAFGDCVTVDHASSLV